MTEQARTVAELIAAIRQLLTHDGVDSGRIALHLDDLESALTAYAAEIWEAAAKECDGRAKQFRDESSRCMLGGLARSARKQQAEAIESIAAALRAHAVSRQEAKP